ncbi:MAG: hypothetical protein ACLSDQ_11770 [Adlercreutzia equolifaciens]
MARKSENASLGGLEEDRKAHLNAAAAGGRPQRVSGFARGRLGLGELVAEPVAEGDKAAVELPATLMGSPRRDLAHDVAEHVEALDVSPFSSRHRRSHDIAVVVYKRNGRGVSRRPEDARAETVGRPDLARLHREFVRSYPWDKVGYCLWSAKILLTLDDGGINTRRMLTTSAMTDKT